jgi:DNA-3-methyladenine glycosylase II
VIAAIVERVGPYGLPARPGGDHFGRLARAIVFQQLNGKAASTIHDRFVGLFGAPPGPDEVLGASPARLRGAGLSAAKAAAIRDLAAATRDGRLVLPVPRRLSDDEVVESVTRVRGIGPWTAHMFLIFTLGRPDVLPTGDYGLASAVRKAYGLRAMPKPARLERIAAPWRPWRSVATWYLWRSLDSQ